MAPAQSVFKSHVLHPHVRLHFLGVEATQDFTFQVRGARCGSEGAKVQRLRTTWQAVSGTVSLSPQVPLGVILLSLNQFQRPFYLIFIFILAISCHLASVKMICFHFVIILCVFKNFL